MKEDITARDDSSDPEDLIKQIDRKNLPGHVAIIMDGNGRWAKKFNKKRTQGHEEGVKSARIIAEACAKIGIKYLTFYTFSTENWKRPKIEITKLMDLLYENLLNNKKLLKDNDIRFNLIGKINKLPSRLQREIQKTVEYSKNNQGMQINMALNYGSRDEMIESVKRIVRDQIPAKDIDERLFKQYLYTKDLPDPDLLIRTSGELRISNFLLFQIAYTELYFTDKFWPEFREGALYEAIINYQSRKRRFGKL